MLEQTRALESSATIKLVTSGRKSRLPHLVEVRFVASHGGIYVIGAGPRSDWVLNALATDRVKVRVGELAIPCRAQRATLQEVESTYGLFKKKYGSGIVSRWYGGSTLCLYLEFAGRAERRGAVVGESETKSDFDAWKASGRGYYDDVAAAFDSASEEYDFTISRNFVNTWIRRRSLEILARYMKKDDVALEIGCGTGAETLQIAKSVRRVVATDISDRMVSLLTAKLRARRTANVMPLKLGAAAIAQAAPYLYGGRASLVYSLNGALNCEPELDAFASGLERILTPGGYFVCSVRNTICLSEAVLHALLLQFGKSLPRLKQPTMVSVGGMDIPSTYYRPSDFASHFKRSFELKKIIALPAILPPAYLSGHYVRLTAVHKPLEVLERAVAGLPPFNRLGDQTLFVFRRFG